MDVGSGFISASLRYRFGIARIFWLGKWAKRNDTKRAARFSHTDVARNGVYPADARGVVAGICLDLVCTIGARAVLGAVWAEPVSRTPEGEPFYSSRVLPYRPYVPAVLVVVSGAIALLLWRSGLKNLLREGWRKRSQFPWLSVCAMLAYGVMSWSIEKLPLEWRPWALREHAQVLEELFETMVYGFAGSAQWHAFRHWLKPD